MKQHRSLPAGIVWGIQYFQFDNQEVARTQYQGFKDYDLILLNSVRSLSSGLIDELYKFIETGGKVTLLPGKDTDITSYNALLSRSGSRTLQSWVAQEKKCPPSTRGILFFRRFSATESNLHLPTTKGAYNFGQTASAGSLSILSYRDGSPYLYRSPVGKANCMFVLPTSTQNTMTLRVWQKYLYPCFIAWLWLKAKVLDLIISLERTI